MKFLLSLAGSKHPTYFRSLGLALMAFIVAMGLAPGAQAQSYKYTARDTFTGLQKRFLSNAVVRGGECEGEAGKKGRFKYESHRDRNTCWRC
jgi:hypothetical protein